MATLAEFGESDRVSVDYDDHAVLIFRADGRYYAIEDLCSHDGQPLTDGPVVGHSVECPRHGARFDLRTGKALCMPAIEPIAVYAVRIEGDQVLLGPVTDSSTATAAIPAGMGLPIAPAAGQCVVPPLPPESAAASGAVQSDSVDEGQMLEALRAVIDPELFVNIVDLGLIYAINLEQQVAKVEMTLTSPACPAGPQLVQQSKQALERLPGIASAEIKLVLNPPWSPARMTDEARDKLGIF
ncbi:MAG: iron-sulfur cluster assembly protein [Planctomycetaceae bacterium]